MQDIDMNTDFDCFARDLLNRLGTLVSTRDLAVLELFDDNALLVGSEAGESASGVTGLRDFFRHVFAWPFRVSWDWTSLRATGQDDVCWFLAEGEVVAASDDAVQRAPYRLSGVMRRSDAGWRFAQFHGAEPVVK